MSKQKGNESNALTQDLESCFSPSEFKFTNLYCGAQPPPAEDFPLEFPDLTYQVVGVLQYTTSLLKYSFFALPMHLYTEPGWTRSGFQYADVEGYFNAIPTKSILFSEFT